MLDIGVYALSLIRWFFAETADQVLSQVKYAPTGVDEQAGILLMNPAGEWQRSLYPFMQNSQNAQP